MLCNLGVALHTVFRSALSLKKVVFCISVKLEPNHDMLFSREIQKAVLLLIGLGIIHRLC